jgi:2-polyprenyl-3-methyl-5-hydroxy-6-metoxy-1,4-benzoquinol methylase
MGWLPRCLQLSGILQYDRYSKIYFMICRCISSKRFSRCCAGVEREFEMAMQLLQPAFGKVLVDMSCGSGVFSRRFASSRQFSGVIAADYSETMLQQTQQTFTDEGYPSDG